MQNLYEFDVARCSPRARILRYKYSASDAKDRFRLIHGSQVTVVLEHVSHLLYVHKGCIGNGLPCALSIWAFGSGACLRRRCNEIIFPCLCLFPSPPLVGASKVQVRLGCGHPGYARTPDNTYICLILKWSILGLFVRTHFRRFCPFFPQPLADRAKMSENPDPASGCAQKPRKPY